MVSLTVYSVVIFSHRYLDIVTASILKRLYSWLFIDPSERYNTTHILKVYVYMCLNLHNVKQCLNMNLNVKRNLTQKLNLEYQSLYRQ